MTAYEREARRLLAAHGIRDESGLALAMATDAVRRGYELGYGAAS